MPNTETTNHDILGLKPYGEAINQTVNKTFSGIEAFLKATCMPAFEELGKMMHDKVRVWRLTNILKIIEKAKGKIGYDENSDSITINPKVALSIIENASNEDNDEIQEMWAGLFITANSEITDDSNNMYVNLLKQLTLSEARYLKYACSNIEALSHPDWEKLWRSENCITIAKFTEVTGISDIEEIESIFLHMISLNVLTTRHNTTFRLILKHHNTEEEYVPYFPSTLGLQLYLRCIAFNGTTQDYLRTMPIKKLK